LIVIPDRRKIMPDPVGPGSTGKFPEGKLRDDDEGEIRVALTAIDGKIIIDFGKPVKWIGLGPTDAILLGENLVKRGKAML